MDIDYLKSCPVFFFFNRKHLNSRQFWLDCSDLINKDVGCGEETPIFRCHSEMIYRLLSFSQTCVLEKFTNRICTLIFDSHTDQSLVNHKCFYLLSNNFYVLNCTLRTVWRCMTTAVNTILTYLKKFSMSIFSK